MKRVPGRITMTQLRSQPGEVLRAVEYDGREITITKNGHDAARLVPSDDVCIVHPDGSFSGALPVTFRRNLGNGY